MKKIIYLSLLLLLGPAACENCSPSFFQIESIDDTPMRHSGQDGVALGELEPVYWEDFFIRFNLNTSRYSWLMHTGASAYADCEPASSVHPLDTLYLTTLTDYNETFEAGENLNPICQVATYSSFRSLEDFVNQNRHAIYNEKFDIRLTEPPTDSIKTYQFALTYILKDGQTFTEQLDEVVILRDR